MSHNAKQLEKAPVQSRIPVATYRCQFNRDFTFGHAAGLVGYLRDLGISDVYASPLFRAGPESEHGYDVCSFAELNPALGSRADFDSLTGQLKQSRLGLLLDMVPNHMGADLSNPWWVSVLQFGPASAFAHYFDIAWTDPTSGAVGKILVPILEDRYGKVLENGKLQLVCEKGSLTIAYHDRRFPLAPSSWSTILGEIAQTLEANRSEGEHGVKGLRSCIDHLQLPSDDDSGPDVIELAKLVRRWMRTSIPFRRALDSVLQTYNGRPGQAATFDRLHTLLSEQHYRLAFWRTASEEINYRRFFDVTHLVSLRMEAPDVYEACHRFMFGLIRSGQVTGLRIDHPDGLQDPKQYFRRLQLSRPPNRPLYVVVEKILSVDEQLRPDWPVSGTTGYDFLNQCNGLFVDAENEAAFDALYCRLAGNSHRFQDEVYLGKKCVLQTSLISELEGLVRRLKNIAERTREGQDFTLGELRAGLVELIATFPVYRTYISVESQQVAPLDRSNIQEALAAAKARSKSAAPDVFDFIGKVLCLDPALFDASSAQEPIREFILRFQQLTGPATAKGLEDTAFYNYNRLLSLNEVGGDASRFGRSVDSFHQANLLRAQRWPHSLLATATHDTKRGEDARARLNVLSEMPAEWTSALERWMTVNKDKKQLVAGTWAPDPNDEFLLYQTLVGSWPFHRADQIGIGADWERFRERIIAYMQKALREAKARTTWSDPNEPYESAVREFVVRVLDSTSSQAFLTDFAKFQRRIAFFGVCNSLSQLLLKITSPGVPDMYQGTELWDFNLVDPDNRRPVDHDHRRQMLADINRRLGREEPAAVAGMLKDFLNHADTGQIKLFLASRALGFRRRRHKLYRDGEYLTLRAVGKKQNHVCAFARVAGPQIALTVVPRLVAGLCDGVEQWPLGESVWLDTALDLAPLAGARSFRNVLSLENVRGRGSRASTHLPVRDALRLFPVGLFEAS